MGVRKPASPESALMFTAHGRPIPGQRVDNAVYAAAGAAGIGHVTPHEPPSHTMATQAKEAGVDSLVIKELMGHESLATTAITSRSR